MGFVFVAMCFHLLNFCLGPCTPKNPTVGSVERGDLDLGKCENLDDPYVCGQLVAPLDYANLSDPRNASIAVAVFPAGGGTTPQSEILGSILLNPGGPGGSGLDFIARRSPVRNNRTLGEALDTQLKGKYNIVSFDPRGVGHTWPKVSCFADDLENLYYSSFTVANGLPGHNGARTMKHEIGTTIAREQLLSNMCQKSEDSELLKYVGTALVVQDMQLIHRALGDDKLHYWGFSYGTVLGSTYADMFPEDVGRVIIDGVVDVPNYYQGKWSDNFKDIEAEFDGFFSECVKSGPEACKLAELAESGPALKDLVLDWGTRLKHHPIPLADANPPQIYSYFMFISGLFQSMYAPVTWPTIADGLYEAIKNGNLSSMASGPGQVRGVEIMQIACGDNLADFTENLWGVKDYERHISELRADSPHFAEFFGQIGLMCDGIWPVRASERHNGNFTSQTNFPLLVLGNDYDPVTPGRYAKKMAGLFPNAVHVQREGYGHCSSSQPSKCIDDIVAAYFLDGELPAPETVCEVDKPVFGVSTESSRTSFSSLLDEAVRKANYIL